MPNTDSTSPPATSTTTAPKPGYLTTEFYLKVAAFVLTALLASGVIPTSGPAATITAIAATMLGSLGYTVSRTLVKNAAIAMLAIVLAIGGSGMLTACSSTQRTTAEHALWDCTALDRAELVAAVTPLADSAIQKATNPDGTIDTAALKATFSKANLTSDGGSLLTCATANAFAAYVAAGQTGQAVSARSAAQLAGEEPASTCCRSALTAPGAAQSVAQAGRAAPGIRRAALRAVPRCDVQDPERRDLSHGRSHAQLAAGLRRGRALPLHVR